MNTVAEKFTALGGRFITPPTEIAGRLKTIKAYVFDWDGVFNSAEKSSSKGSTFNEVDSMSVNLLRFAHYLRTGTMPVTLVISGEKNETAFFYSERENFRYSFYKIPHKREALDFLCASENLDPKEVCYFFDDVLDVPIAARCGLRLQVNQRSNPLFLDYCVSRGLTDYLSSARGGDFAIREMVEMLLGVSGQFDQVIDARVNNAPEYQRYISERRRVTPRFFTLRDGQITEADPRADARR